VKLAVALGCLAVACTPSSNDVAAKEKPIPKRNIQIGGKVIQKLDAAGIRAAVAEYNKRPDAGRKELPDDLNPRCVNADEAVAFVDALPRIPEDSKRAIAGQVLDLADEALKLHPVDGFGVHALRDNFTISRERGRWIMKPDVNRADLEAELTKAVALVAKHTERRAKAQAEVDAMNRDDPAFPPRFRELAIIKQEQALAWSVALDLVRKAGPLAAQKPIQVGSESWDAARVTQEQATLLKNLETAPAVGGMPGGAPGGGAPGGAPGGGMP
jgi:hypothetical protein